jgi:ribA/ribD-fused uncharacterized protein
VRHAIPPPIPTTIIVPSDNRVLYYRRDRAEFRFLSHFHPAPIEIEIDGEVWPTVEHYFQAQKSLDPEYRTAILGAAHPAFAKQLAADPKAPRRFSKRSWFKATGKLPRPEWDGMKLDVMRRADAAKFAQYPPLAALLLATGSAELVEDSPTEPFWGTGEDGAGSNWAGRILMEVRKNLVGA